MSLVQADLRYSEPLADSPDYFGAANEIGRPEERPNINLGLKAPTSL